jgi:outer membrane lipoprotein carrier protein
MAERHAEEQGHHLRADRIGLKDGAPQAMELKDNFGQTTVLKFTSFQRNPQLGPQQFKFDVPKGAEVVNQ